MSYIIYTLIIAIKTEHKSSSLSEKSSILSEKFSTRKSYENATSSRNRSDRKQVATIKTWGLVVKVGILTANETPCWGGRNELQIHPPTLLLCC